MVIIILTHSLTGQPN